MNRQLKLLAYALAALGRRRARTLSLVVVYAFVVASLASILFLTGALQQEAAAVLEGAPDLVVQRLAAGRHDPIPADRAPAIARIAGVRRAEPRVWGYYYDTLSKANYTLLGVDGPERTLPLLAGTLPADAGECALGDGVARVLRIAVGGEIILTDGRGTGTPFTVVGVFSSRSALLAHDLVLIRREELRDFFALAPGLATDIVVRVGNPREVSTVAGKIKRLYPDARLISRDDMARTYDAVFTWRGGMLLAVFSSAAVAFCILAWDRATGAAAEDRREVGILKAVGWDTAHVLAWKFWEGAAISLTAFLVGALAGWVHVFLLGAPLLARVMKGWSVLFPSFPLVAAVDPFQLFALAFLTIVPYLAATVLPTWRLASLDPDSVLRG